MRQTYKYFLYEYGYSIAVTMNHIDKVKGVQQIVIVFCILVLIVVSVSRRRHRIEHMRSSPRCVVVTPAGRRQYLEILFAHLYKQKQDFDEWHLWMNTSVDADISYMQTLAAANKWIKLVHHVRSDPSKGINNIINFFDHAVDPNTIYLRLDDDIVWLEDGFISKFYKQRLDNRQYFLVYANIINNAIITHLHQRSGAFWMSDKFVEYSCMGNGWTDTDIVTQLHQTFIEDVKIGALDKWRRSFNTWIALGHERISINAIAWFGQDMSQVDRSQTEDEEEYMSSVYPKIAGKYNIVVGQPLCAHYAFYTQRSHLDTTSVLAKYRELARL